MLSIAAVAAALASFDQLDSELAAPCAGSVLPPIEELMSSLSGSSWWRLKLRA